jgi:hypothetical protein
MSTLTELQQKLADVKSVRHDALAVIVQCDKDIAECENAIAALKGGKPASPYRAPVDVAFPPKKSRARYKNRAPSEILASLRLYLLDEDRLAGKVKMSASELCDLIGQRARNFVTAFLAHYPPPAATRYTSNRMDYFDQNLAERRKRTLKALEALEKHLPNQWTYYPNPTEFSDAGAALARRLAYEENHERPTNQSQGG